MRTPGFRFRPGLESLDERLVPATLADLTTRAAAAAVGDALVRQVDAQPTGTGNIRSFLRVQGAANGGGSEQGYNTDARPLQFDENKSPQFTRSLTLGSVPVVTVGGVNYREFLLDINQKASDSKLSLDELRIFTSASGTLGGAGAYSPATGQLAGASLKFTLAGSVLLDARLNSGSGSGDMILLVPDANFAGGKVTDFVYLYSKFGATAGATANGGFEEWAVRAVGTPVAPPPVTEPPAAGTATLSGRVYAIDFNNLGAGQIPLAGVVVHLSWLDANGNNWDITTTTDANGYYQFTGIAAGEYAVWEEQPDGFTSDGVAFAGTVDEEVNGTTLGGNRITSVYLAAGSVGVDYNFSEVIPKVGVG